MRVVNEEGAALSATITRILVVDDFEPWRRFIWSGVSNQPNLQIVAEASDGLEALQKAEQLQPDLILLDIGLPALNGIEAARRIRRLSPNSKILFVSEHRSIDIAKEAIRAGGSGYLVKSSAGNDLLPAMAAVPPSGITVSAKMRPAIGPTTLMCFCSASLVAAIFQPNRCVVE